MKHKKILTIILGFIAINIYFLVLLIFEKPIEGKMKVIFFDVGQGDASLIMAESGKNILIDGGPDKTVIEKLDKYLPIWNKKIDIAILTHPHSDHVLGLVDVLKKYTVGEVWITGVLHNTPEYIEFLKIIRDKKIKTNIVRAAGNNLEFNTPFPQVGELLKGGNRDIKIEILYPDKNLFQQSIDNLNNSSIVLKVSYKNKSFLFAGDIGKEVENELCKKYQLKGEGNLDADVLKIPHHGSSTSSLQNFLEKVKPSMAVISVGVDNDFGMPSLRILKRLETMGIKVYRTDLDGDIIMETDGNLIDILR